MNKAEIIEEVSRDEKYLAYCKRVFNGRDAYKDLYQYTILALYEMDDEKLIYLHTSGGLRNYVARMIYLGANSTTSAFYRQMRGFDFAELSKEHTQVADEKIIDPCESSLNEFDKEMEKECNRCIQANIYPAAVKIYEIYEQIGSYKEVSECTMIPYKTVQRYVHGTREKILNNLHDKGITGNTGK